MGFQAIQVGLVLGWAFGGSGGQHFARLM